MATGVLPLVLGKATRLARFLTSDAKRYQAEVRLGWATDTYDRLGEQAGDAVAMDVTREQVEAALTPFRGEITQTPPPVLREEDRRRERPSARPPRRGGDAGAGADDGASPRIAGFLRRSADARRPLLRRLLRALAGPRPGRRARLRRAPDCPAPHRPAATGRWPTRCRSPTASATPRAMRARVVPMSGLLTSWPAVTVTADGERRVRHGQMLRPADLLSPPGLARAGDRGDASAGRHRTPDRHRPAPARRSFASGSRSGLA